MIRWPGLLKGFFVWMILFFPGFSAFSLDRNGSLTKVPGFVAGISISGSPISDHQGNFVGVTIPLKRAGRLFLLDGILDNVSGNFIFDTGDSGLVLNKTYFRSSMIFDK